jgi:hypothetical protein
MSEFADQMMSEKTAEMRDRWGMQVATKDRGAAVEFLTNTVDELIRWVEQTFQLDGAKKKELVLAAVDKIYDTVIVGMLPFWARPFSGLIKKFVVDTVANVLIDFIVSKYNASEWKVESV